MNDKEELKEKDKVFDDSALPDTEAVFEPIFIEQGALQLQPLALETLPERQKQEVQEYRMLTCIDDSYRKNKIIDNRFTIDEYQKYFNNEFQRKIQVYDARTVNNDLGLAICMDNELYQVLSDAKDPRFTLKCHDDSATTEPVRAIYTASTGVTALRQALENSVLLIPLRAKIEELNKKGVSGDIVQSFQKLYAALNNHKDTGSFKIITEHFIQEADKTLQHSKRSQRDIVQSNKKLRERLYGKPPMHAAVRIAVYALIGALLGTAASVSLGTFAGGIAGAFFGFYHAKKQKVEYKERAKTIREQIHGDVKLAMWGL